MFIAELGFKYLWNGYALLYQVGIQNKGISHDFFICTNWLLALIPPICKNIFLLSTQFTLMTIPRTFVLVVRSEGLSSDYSLEQRTLEISCCRCFGPRVPGSFIATVFVSWNCSQSSSLMQSALLCCEDKTKHTPPLLLLRELLEGLEGSKLGGPV